MQQDDKPTDTTRVQGDTPAEQGDIPKPVLSVRRKGRISWIWLVPLVAALAGVTLLVRDWMNTGPTVVIRFESAEGLAVGQTKLRYRDVVVGQVADIRVAPDRTGVLVFAQLDRDGSKYITRKDTRFWVVRPRLGISGISGLSTLLSGPYIGVDTQIGQETGDRAVTHFVGLESPPEIASMRPGSRFTLHAAELNSIDIGSPVYYRRIQVGQVIGYELDSTGSSVNVQVFIDQPNDRFVTQDARFWNASGFQASLGADGFNLQMASVASLISGGISFASASDQDTKPAAAGTAFELAPNRQAAMADHDGTPVQLALQFKQSVRGLQVGAPVDFRGLELGRVQDIDMMYDNESNLFYALVKAEIYPMRLGNLYEDLARLNPDDEGVGEWLFEPMVKNGMRAQLRLGNLLTGQQYVALDFFPDDKLATPFNGRAVPLQLPTVPGDFNKLQLQISSIVTKIDALPFEGISNDLRRTLRSFAVLADKANAELTPQAAAVLKSARKSLDVIGGVVGPGSELTENLSGTLRQVEGAARALRTLADYLQAHPGSLLRGRDKDVLPPGP